MTIDIYGFLFLEALLKTWTQLSKNLKSGVLAAITDAICFRMFMVALETVKESRKNWNFHFDLQLHPTVLNGTYLYCQIIDFIPARTQIF